MNRFMHIMLRLICAFCMSKGVNVDNQKVTVFRQKNRWGLTIAGIVACLLLSLCLVIYHRAGGFLLVAMVGIFVSIWRDMRAK